MGLLYSIVSYFYSPTSPIPSEQIKLSAQKLSIGMKHKMNKIQQKNHQMEVEFIEMINKPKRDLFMERVKIDNMVQGSISYGGTFFSNILYEELWYCSQRIRDEAERISGNLNKVSDECLAAIYSIVHLYKDMGLEEYINLKEFIPEPYPVIGIEKLQENIRKFLEYKQSTDYQRNLYVLEVIKRHQGKVSLLQLNKVNHGFSNHPELPKNQILINSNNLYARSASYMIPQDQAQFAA